MRHDRIVNVFPHNALILLLDGGFSPQGVDAVHSHGHAEDGVRLPALQPQLLHHSPHHITAALRTRYTLRQRKHQQKPDDVL